jgi:hypothetical protein
MEDTPMKTMLSLLAAGLLTVALSTGAAADFEDWDLDLDGGIDFEEYGNHWDLPDEQFKAYDTNQDGLIDEEEFEEHGLEAPQLEPRDLGAGAETDEDFLGGLLDTTD